VVLRVIQLYLLTESANRARPHAFLSVFRTLRFVMHAIIDALLRNAPMKCVKGGHFDNLWWWIWRIRIPTLRRNDAPSKCAACVCVSWK